MLNIKQLIDELQKIKGKGFIKTTHPHQGGVGNTLETLLGIKENNLRIPDLGVVELKAKRINSNSMLTLSSKSPLPRGTNRRIFEFLKRLGDDGIYRLYTTVYGSRKNNRGLRVFIENSKLILVNPANEEAYWILEILDDVLKKGTQKVLLVLAETKGKLGSKREMFHYTEAYLLSGLNFKNLKYAIEHDKLLIDIRIGADLHGKAAGKYHDHGTGFRIHKKDYLQLFEKHEKLI
ncbi:MAG: MvaI/BcnI family restriction endonuclease [Patescibacteria group bacterium]